MEPATRVERLKKMLKRKRDTACLWLWCNGEVCLKVQKMLKSMLEHAFLAYISYKAVGNKSAGACSRRLCLHMPKHGRENSVM